MSEVLILSIAMLIFNMFAVTILLLYSLFRMSLKAKFKKDIYSKKTKDNKNEYRLG